MRRVSEVGNKMSSGRILTATRDSVRDAAKIVARLIIVMAMMRMRREKRAAKQGA